MLTPTKTFESIWLWSERWFPSCNISLTPVLSSSERLTAAQTSLEAGRDLRNKKCMKGRERRWEERREGGSEAERERGKEGGGGREAEERGRRQGRREGGRHTTRICEIGELLTECLGVIPFLWAKDRFAKEMEASDIDWPRCPSLHAEPPSERYLPSLVPMERSQRESSFVSSGELLGWVRQEATPCVNP